MHFLHIWKKLICAGVQKNGYKIEYIGNSTVYHVGGASLDNTNPKKTYLNFRNSLYSLVKNTQYQLIIVIYLRLLLDGLAGLKFFFQGKPNHTFAIIKAHWSFYKALPRLVKLRRQSIKTTKSNNLLPSIVWSHFVLKIKRY